MPVGDPQRALQHSPAAMHGAPAAEHMPVAIGTHWLATHVVEQQSAPVLQVSPLR